MTVEVRRGSARFLHREVGRITRHSFSFGDSYDPENTAFGPLVCHDDHLLRPGLGFPDHSHRDLEIVTWVLSGAVRHEGTAGAAGLVVPGQVQVLSAGAGVVHSEVADTGSGPTRFVQAWLTPDQTGGEPAYAKAEVTLEPGRLVPVVSGHDPAAVGQIGTASATLSVALLGRGDELVLPDDPRQHVFVATGALARSSLAEPLAAGDAFRVEDQPGLHLVAAAPSQLLVWTFTG